MTLLYFLLLVIIRFYYLVLFLVYFIHLSNVSEDADTPVPDTMVVNALGI